MAQSLAEFLLDCYQDNYSIDLKPNNSSHFNPFAQAAPDPDQAVATIDEFFSARAMPWKLSKLVRRFRVAHQNRYSHKMFDEDTGHSGTTTINSQFLTHQEVRRNKSMQSVTPHDKRKYKQDAVEYLLSNFTYNPKINANSNQMALTNR